MQLMRAHASLKLIGRKHGVLWLTSHKLPRLLFLAIIRLDLTNQLLYPEALADALHIASFTTHNGRVQMLADWKQLLPVSLTWPAYPYRVEDGGGLPSAALCISPCGVPVMRSLREKGFRRLCDSHDCRRIVARLQSGQSCPPLSVDELQPYLDDLLSTLDHNSDRESILSVIPGQPFRLQLWKLLVETWNDPDANFLDLLAVGVPLDHCNLLQRGQCRILLCPRSPLCWNVHHLGRVHKITCH